MREQILASIETRIKDEITNKNPSLRCLLTADPRVYIDTVTSILYMYTRVGRGTQSVYFAELISAIGHAVRNKLKLKKDSRSAAKIGAFLLYTYEMHMIVQVSMGAGAKGHQAYIVKVIDDESLANMFSAIETRTIDKLPATTPYAAWITSIHETGMPMVKTGSKEVIGKITPETHPMLFECLNRAQEIGWQVNEDVFKIQAWALRNKTDAFSDIWEQTNPQARETKLREARAIGDIAKRLSGATFYHLYYYDFRGRKYPTSAYLHEQGSDLARGLLLRSDKKAITEAGFFWLLVSIASNWAGDAGREDKAKTDKIPIKDRFLWCLDNEEILLSYAESPKVNQGWMKADKPWQFLAGCIELMKLRIWQLTEGSGLNDYAYESHFECYIDGSNNGSQHLAALTKDDETAVHVNLVPSALPGDLYAYVAEHVWASIADECALLNDLELEACHQYIDTLIDMKKQIQQTEPKSELRAQLIEEMKNFREAYKDIGEMASPVFWNSMTDLKQRRKVCKRNVMTLPYGGTRFGLGQQQIDDSKKHGIEKLYHMEHKWGAYLGSLLYNDCRVSLAKPMQLLQIFEEAGEQAEKNGEFLSWTVPVTNFPVTQYYTEGVKCKLWVRYGPVQGEKTSTGYYPNEYQINICEIEKQVPSKGKQSTGASPNIIHSLDAAHLILTIIRASFPITTIHDSFGCLLADMPDLYRLIRETFVELYQSDPLASVMHDIKGDINRVEFGKLDVSQILDSEYAFV